MLGLAACTSAQNGLSARLDYRGGWFRLGDTLQLTLTVSSQTSVPGPQPAWIGARVGFYMDPGLEIVNPQWPVIQESGGQHKEYFHDISFQAGQPQTFDLEVKMVKAGYQDIAGLCQILTAQGPQFSAKDKLYLHVDTNSVSIQRSPFDAMRTPKAAS